MTDPDSTARIAQLRARSAQLKELVKSEQSSAASLLMQELSQIYDVAAAQSELIEVLVSKMKE